MFIVPLTYYCVNYYCVFEKDMLIYYKLSTECYFKLIDSQRINLSLIVFFYSTLKF